MATENRWKRAEEKLAGMSIILCVYFIVVNSVQAVFLTALNTREKTGTQPATSAKPQIRIHEKSRKRRSAKERSACYRSKEKLTVKRKMQERLTERYKNRYNSIILIHCNYLM